MAKFRKKPVVIDAVQISKQMGDSSPDWLADAALADTVILRGMGRLTRDLCFVEIKTLEGVMRGNEGDWIIRGVAGELYPCKREIFEETYELVDE